jgi:hypothetical protein
MQELIDCTRNLYRRILDIGSFVRVLLYFCSMYDEANDVRN